MNNHITLNASMRSNLLSLRNISKQMDKTQLILATGKKVNSAIDNASSYYQARSLTNRAADLTALLDAMGQGIQTIEAATQGLTSGAEFLEQATAVVNEAASNVKYDFSDYTRVSTVEELKAAIADSNIDKIVVTQSLTFADNETITLTKGKTLAGLTQDVSLNFTRTDNANKNYSMLTIQDGCKLQNITVNSVLDSGAWNTYAISVNNAKNGAYLDDVIINAEENNASTGMIGLYSSGSNLFLNDLYVSINGKSSKGVYAALSNVYGNCCVETEGNSAYGMYAYNKTTLDGSFNIITNGSTAYGVYATSSSLLGTYNIETNGTTAHCIGNDGSTMSGIFNLICKNTGGAVGMDIYRNAIIKSNCVFNILTPHVSINFPDATTVIEKALIFTWLIRNRRQ